DWYEQWDTAGGNDDEPTWTGYDSEQAAWDAWDDWGEPQWKKTTWQDDWGEPQWKDDCGEHHWEHV
ncbi:unnamed protein product, partial [Durusdinium trenchii]